MSKIDHGQIMSLTLDGPLVDMCSCGEKRYYIQWAILQNCSQGLKTKNDCPLVQDKYIRTLRWRGEFTGSLAHRERTVKSLLVVQLICQNSKSAQKRKFINHVEIFERLSSYKITGQNVSGGSDFCIITSKCP